MEFSKHFDLRCRRSHMNKMSATLKSLRALSDPTRLRIVALAGAGRTVGQRAAGNHAARAIAHLDASGLVAGFRAGAIAARRQTDVLQTESAGRRRRAANSSNWPIRGAQELPEHAQRPDQSEARPRAPPRTGAGLFQPGRRALRPRFTARAVRGRRSGICCCAFCRRWSSPIWARAKVC